MKNLKKMSTQNLKNIHGVMHRNGVWVQVAVGTLLKKHVIPTDVLKE